MSGEQDSVAGARTKKTAASDDGAGRRRLVIVESPTKARKIAPYLGGNYVVESSVGDPVRLYGASTAYAREERYHLALRIVRRHFGTLSTSGDPALPRARAAPY